MALPSSNHPPHHLNAFSGPGPALRAFSGVLSLCVLLISLGTVACAIFLPEKPAYALAGMQFVSAIAAIFGLLWARGAFGVSPGLALASIQLSIAICTFLSYVSFRGALGPVPMKVWLVVLFALVLTQSLIAAASVLGRNLAGWPLFWRASVFGIGTLLGCSVFVWPISGALVTWAGWARLGVEAFAAVFAALCACAAVHLAVAAFESSHIRD